MTASAPDCAAADRERPLRVVIAGWIAYPFGAASGARVRLYAKGLHACGFGVRILSTRQLPERPEDRQPDGTLAFEGIPYETTAGILRRDGAAGWRRARRFWAATRAAQTRLAALIRNGEVDAVLAYSRSFLTLHRIVSTCRTTRTPLVADAVEWFEPSRYRLGRFNPHYLDNALGRSHCVRRCSGVIAISAYLERHYRARGMPVLRIPAMGDVAPAAPQPPAPAATRDFNLIYVGSFKPGDGFEETLEAVRLARARHCPVRLTVMGAARWPSTRRNPSLQQSIAVLQGQNALQLAGRVTDEDYRQRLQTAHALILARTPGITAEAAFPTRIPEFLSTGRPVITTAVPDVPDYLTDRVHAHVVPLSAPLPGTIADRILELHRDPAAANAIGAAGAAQAARCFDYRHHTRRLADFLRSLQTTTA